MAEYYPLLSKAVGSLPNSTTDTRRVVYERARKALIGQLRTLHPPIPEEDIDRESVELDKAIARLEDELAAPETAAPAPAADAPPTSEALAAPSAPSLTQPAIPPHPTPPARVGGSLGPAGSKPFAPLRTKMPAPKTTPRVSPAAELPPPPIVIPTETPPSPVPEAAGPPPSATEVEREKIGNGRARIDSQRPIAPLPPTPKGPKRQMWIIWVGIGLVVLLVAGAAWKLRDHPETLIAKKPAEQPAQSDSGKIAERVGNAKKPTADAPTTPTPDEKKPESPANSSQPVPAEDSPPAPPTANNPQVPVAQRAALLIEAPDEPNKVKTFLGNVVWKLNNVSEGPSDTVGVAVEAAVELPDDKLKAIVSFEKNTDSSLPASHTIKVRFQIQPGSASGDVKQISVPQLRKEDSPSGEPLAGVTVPVIQNSFLVGLSPGNAETANMQLLRSLQWIDIPMLLSNGKIAKLTFEKGAPGERDLDEAISAWQKQ